MSNIILQPAGNKNARAHYNDTIEKAVSIERLTSFVDPILPLRCLDYFEKKKLSRFSIVIGGSNR